MVRGRVAGTLGGMVALLIAVPAHAETGGVGGSVPPDPIVQPGQQTHPSNGGGGGLSSIPAGAPTGRVSGAVCRGTLVTVQGDG